MSGSDVCRVVVPCCRVAVMPAPGDCTASNVIYIVYTRYVFINDRKKQHGKGGKTAQSNVCACTGMLSTRIR